MPDPELLKMPRELDAMIVSYRNTRVEHVEEPRLRFATQWGSDKKAKIAPMLVHPKGSELESPQKPSGDIDEIMDLLDRYLTAMLDLFDANAEKSILPSASPSA